MNTIASVTFTVFFLVAPIVIIWLRHRYITRILEAERREHIRRQVARVAENRPVMPRPPYVDLWK